MPKAISEMSLEELQDYALGLEENARTASEERERLNTQITELNTLNHALQRRNNDLLMKVENRPTAEPTADPAPVETCEDFARRIKI